MATSSDIAKDLSPDFYVDNISVGTSVSKVIPEELNVLKGVQLKSLFTNTGIIYIGRSGVSATTGFPLSAGEGLFIPIKDVTKISAISDTAAQSLRWLAI